MGRYLDIARKFEERRRAEGRAPLQRPASPAQLAPSQQEAPADYRRFYEEMLRAILEDFHLPWLVEAHPVLGRRLKELDAELSRLEEQGVPETTYRAKLNELVTLCHEVKTLREGKWGALLVKSALLGGEVWVIRDEQALALVKDDERLVFFLDEVPLLKDKSPEQLGDILKAKLVFPGCRVVQ